MQNPYLPPHNTSEKTSRPEAVSEALNQIAVPVFLAWEKLRLVYVGLLAGLTILLSLLDITHMLLAVDFWIDVVAGAVITNVCYFAGPAVETYVAWLGYRPQWLRMTLFVTGSVFSCLAVILFILSVLAQTFI
jgi:hypothetical protein